MTLQDLVDGDPALPFAHFVDRLQERRRQRRVRATLQLAGGSGLAIVLAFVAIALAPAPTTDVAAPPEQKTEDFVVDVGIDVMDLTPIGSRVLVSSPQMEVRVVSAEGEVTRSPFENRFRVQEDFQLHAASASWLFVSSTSIERLFRVEVANGSIVDAVKGYVRNVAVSNDYVWRDNGDGTISRLEVDSLEPTGRVEVIEDLGDYQSRVSSDIVTAGHAVWVADGHTGDVVRIDERTMGVQRISIGPAGGPENSGIVRAYVDTVVEGGGLIWACCDERARLAVIDPVERTVVGTVDLPGGRERGAGGVVFGGGALWFEQVGALYRVDPGDLSVEGPFYPGGDPYQMVATRDGLVMPKTEVGGSRLLAIPYEKIPALPRVRAEDKIARGSWWPLLLFIGALGMFVVIVGLRTAGRARDDG
jgi:hypothetical protein